MIIDISYGLAQRDHTIEYVYCINSISENCFIKNKEKNIISINLFSFQSTKKKSTRAVLYISGDGLRVVDEKTRGLLVDQV